MKRFSRIVLPLAALALVLALVGMGCEGDQGPPGPAGAATCLEKCHTDDYQVAAYIRAKQAEYAASQHARAESVVRRSSSCARCHTTEGFQHYAETGEAIAVDASSPIGCFACHAPHSNQDFRLRTDDPVDLMVGGMFDKMEGNLCANCHQARTPEPEIEDVATAITSSRWGTHHGPQSNVLSGQGAWEFGGSISGAHAHNTIANGCVGCHMATTADNGFGGGHSFSIAFVYHDERLINSKGCVQCHTGWDDDEATAEVEERHEEFDELLQDLADALIQLGWISSSGTSVSGANIPADADARGAVFNYQMLREDLSRGVHNPNFIDNVLEETMDYVNTQLALAQK